MFKSETNVYLALMVLVTFLFCFSIFFLSDLFWFVESQSSLSCCYTLRITGCSRKLKCNTKP